jgi:hypothetical protein
LLSSDQLSSEIGSGVIGSGIFTFDKSNNLDGESSI